MKVLVAGATGVIGRQLVPLLVEVGHDVIALARRADRSWPSGVEAVTVDALDRDSVESAVRRTAPNAVVNLLSAVPDRIDPRRLAAQMERTNQLRREGTAALIAAAPDAHHVFAGVAYAYDPAAGSPAVEDRSLWVHGPRPFRPVVAALRHAEAAVGEVSGTVLRFGHLYGPGTAFAPDGSFVEQLRTRRAPIVGSGGSVFSFTHTHDAATAVVAALDRPRGGVFNIVDDEPAPVSEWMPHLAELCGAPPPRRVPALVARAAAGAWGVAFMTSLVGADNRRARWQLDWRPGHRSWRAGFAAEHAGRDRRPDA